MIRVESFCCWDVAVLLYMCSLGYGIDGVGSDQSAKVFLVFFLLLFRLVGET